MPRCGSQVILCDIPIRFDTYDGCSHGCAYCFVKRCRDINDIANGESAISLRNFIEGKRTAETNWCDWEIPLHWGGMSDPFQPIEKIRKRSLECLRVFAETKYPFVVSTKNKLIATEPYLSLIKDCNCVVQFSAACEKYDKYESGASSFLERMQAAKEISKFKRVNIRVQPYIPIFFKEILKSIDLFSDAGVHGVIFESIKYTNKRPGLIKLGADFVYPTDLLKQQYIVMKDKLHYKCMKFYCGENRLRSLGDELCCCGVEGLGWRVNTLNLNHLVYDMKNVHITEKMKQKGTSICFKSLNQNSEATRFVQLNGFAKCMKHYFKEPYVSIVKEDKSK